MVAMRYLLAALVVCAASASARHRRAEPAAELSEDSPAAAEEHDADVRRHRRKRWYTSYGYQQPTYRDEAPAPAPAPYDPFAYIYRRLDELAALIRQPLPPPPPPQAPIFVPYPVYFPQGGCGCPAAGSAVPSPPATNGTGVTFPNRIREEQNDDYDDMPLRPLSFDPVKPDRPLSRPVPGVEHGSSQAGVSATGQQGREPANGGAAAPPVSPQSGPSRCDFAILTCCHQRYTTNQCFNSLGCPSALNSANPCDSRTLADVVTLFKNFYRTQN